MEKYLKKKEKEPMDTQTFNLRRQDGKSLKSKEKLNTKILKHFSMEQEPIENQPRRRHPKNQNISPSLDLSMPNRDNKPRAEENVLP